MELIAISISFRSVNTVGKNWAFSREREWFSCYGIANTQLVSDASTTTQDEPPQFVSHLLACSLTITIKII